MKRVLSLGITNPLHRVIVWLTGCAVCSIAGAIAGPLALAGVMLVLTFVLMGRLTT